MPKKCILCGEEAAYAIKGTSNYYCEDCAAENFSDLAMLIKVEQIAQNLKERLDEIQANMPDSCDADEAAEDRDAEES